MQAWKHVFAIAAAVLAVVASLLQALKAREKSRRHGAFAAAEPEGTLKRILDSDVEHFRRVGVLWYVLFAGALLTLAAEIIDLWG